jgi:very-short-patch-repair endonuclease
MGGVSLNPPRHGEGDRAQRGGGGVPRAHRPEVDTARRLRREMSLPEVLVWQRLKGSKAGARFRRQHPIGAYIVDFYCAEARLVVEIDGEVHTARLGADEARDRFLAENGYKVVRVTAAEVLNDVDRAVEAIASLVAPPLHRPAGGPPPRAGEDRR